MSASEGRLTAVGRGFIDPRDGVLVVKRIEVRYHLKIDADEQREPAERAHRHHVSNCPVAQTLQGCVEIETKLEMSTE